MIRLFRHYMPLSVLVLGIVEIAILFAAVYQGDAAKLAFENLSQDTLTSNLPKFLLFVFVVDASMIALGLYQRETCRDIRITSVSLIFALAAAALILSVIFFMFPGIKLWRSIFLLGFVFAFVGIVLARLVFMQVVDLERFKRRILVLGAGPRAGRIADLLERRVGEDFTVVDYLRMPEESAAVPVHHDASSIDSLLDYCRDNDVDEIVTAAEERRGSLPLRALLTCKLGGVLISDYSSFMERETGRVDLDALVPSWLIYSDGGRRTQVDALVKRVIDISASLILLAVALPFIVVAGILVYLTSRGPTLFKQERVGRYGKVFNLLKLRTMRVDAEQDGVPRWAAENDPRVTLIGRFLRATRIDELPQIFNVLVGDMSFVGPRPERPYFVETLTKELPYYVERHAVKPGITGWAQVRYPYGATVDDAREKVQYDLYYIKNYSVFLDLLILFQTVRVILFSTGAR